MNSTPARLRALRRQAGARPRLLATAPMSRGGLDPPAGVAQLRRLLRLREPRVAPAAGVSDRLLPGQEIGPGLRLIEARIPAPALPARLGGAFDRRRDFDPHRVLFFDTETTGLAGGTGTRAFLLGTARWQSDALHVRQVLITRLAAEAGMLAEFARELATDPILVSYNGKSYDAPLLRTRYRLARLPDPMAGKEHVDLLHPARRRYRGAFANCRLATIEREVLGIVRDDDLPGSQAPAAWRGYLRGGSARNLGRIVVHNRQDVISLMHLLRHLGSA